MKVTRAVINDLGRKFSDTTILMHEAMARRAGLTGTDHKYLGILTQHGAMTAGQLANYTGLTTGAVTGVIDRLEKKKLVKRQLDVTDRRKIMIVPNEENIEKVLGKLFDGLRKKMSVLISGLSEHDVRVVEKYMLSTISVMEEVTQDLQRPNKKTK